ncbi:hypothetical protein [Shewanella baltica]|uniref:hypothetical protein n=1 Tax=Shewanella baltica TaxID=62322 RepID=UPI00217EFC3A|nr:hypothetical protein [Shewanella baltica]MCS6190564.1 hypothetical protein [Shewanella baltica]
MNHQINLSISTHKLAQLIHDGHLCAADFRCLDSQSKQQVWQLCLICCQKRITCQKCTLSSCTKNLTSLDADK